MKRKVIACAQSPMNKQRWMVELECGHIVWITRRGYPKIQTLDCPHCIKAREGGE